ncbi:MAG TPA: hypothetical protein VMS17_23225 [Gemmataceae bacterium]|nr:hypothetical protein [Gemmataceae bacterium]
MSILDDTEIIPTNEGGDAPAPSRFSRAVPDSRRDHPAAAAPAGLLAGFLAALQRALAVWST